MNETSGKPTTGTWCSTLFNKWHGIFYMPSYTDTAGHKAFDYPVMDHWEESHSALARGRFEPTTCQSTLDHTNHQTTITIRHGLTSWITLNIQISLDSTKGRRIKCKLFPEVNYWCKLQPLTSNSISTENSLGVATKFATAGFSNSRSAEVLLIRGSLKLVCLRLFSGDLPPIRGLLNPFQDEALRWCCGDGDGDDPSENVMSGTKSEPNDCSAFRTKSCDTKSFRLEFNNNGASGVEGSE